MTTQSGQTGTKLIDEYDFFFRVKGTYSRGKRAVFQAISPKAYKWIIEERTTSSDGVFTVDTEYAEEIKQLIKASGLTILER